MSLDRTCGYPVSFLAVTRDPRTATRRRIDIQPQNQYAPARWERARTSIETRGAPRRTHSKYHPQFSDIPAIFQIEGPTLVTLSRNTPKIEHTISADRFSERQGSRISQRDPGSPAARC